MRLSPYGQLLKFIRKKSKARGSDVHGENIARSLREVPFLMMRRILKRFVSEAA